MMVRRATPFVVLVSLAGCAAGGCDPGSAGFFSGIGCSAGGGYNQRSTSLQQQAGYEQGIAAQAAQGSAVARADADAAESQELALRRQVTLIQSGNADLQRRLVAARARRGASDQQYQAAQAHLSQLEEQTKAQLAGSPDPAEVARLQQSRRALLAELGSL
jgi:hypothetical protein